MKLKVLKGMSLTTEVYRGYASAKLLAEISEADVYDQKTNKDGTQRDLSRSHALEANKYGAGKGDESRTQRVWPEVFLNVRDTSVVSISRPDPNGLVTLNARTMEILESFQRQDGIVPCSLGLRLVLCKKKAD